MKKEANEEKSKIDIYYDGDCPFCNNFVSMIHLRENFTPVLHDLRLEHEARDRYERAGYDVDEGMVVEYRGDVYHGHTAVWLMSSLSSGRGAFNWLAVRVFKSQSFSKLIYPIMKAGRNTTLWLLGRDSFKSSA